MELHTEDFPDDANALIAEAGNVLAHEVFDLQHHHIGDCWEAYGDPAYELRRLQEAMDRMETAIKAARSQLETAVAKPARARAMNRR